jgi:23S rRNA U2552 (ribose-2'-O)-methylase RlmE/FtsJ
MDNRLTTKAKWEAVWAGTTLPVVRTPTHDIQKQLETHLPRGHGVSLIEIGCAPGGWMAYFSQHFGYCVTGLEYVETAAEVTTVNMRLLHIDARVLVKDFFALDCKHDVVFSAGFVEHFREPSPVVEMLCSLSQQYVVTIVPNVRGVNGFISRTLRPSVYAEHYPIDVAMLDHMHARCGLKTLFCNYVGGARFIMPAAHHAFFRKHEWCAIALNAPFYVWNRLSNQVHRYGIPIPRTTLWSDSLLYVGKR